MRSDYKCSLGHGHVIMNCYVTCRVFAYCRYDFFVSDSDFLVLGLHFPQGIIHEVSLECYRQYYEPQPDEGAKTYFDQSITSSANSQWGRFGIAKLEQDRSAAMHIIETCRSVPCVLRTGISNHCFKSQQLDASGPPRLHYGDKRHNCISLFSPFS